MYDGSFQYLSIMNTAWDPEFGKYEWGWHSLQTDLRLAMMNPNCAGLVGGTAAGLKMLDTIPVVRRVARTMNPKTSLGGAWLGALSSVLEGGAFDFS